MNSEVRSSLLCLLLLLHPDLSAVQFLSGFSFLRRVLEACNFQSVSFIPLTLPLFAGRLNALCVQYLRARFPFYQPCNQLPLHPLSLQTCKRGVSLSPWG